MVTMLTNTEFQTYPMNYKQWMDTFGKYRWYRKDGTPRTQYPLDGQWEEIYKLATEYTDISFSYRNIYDVEIFTDEFISLVPINWMRYKTTLELFSGTLDGTNIDPLIFEAGFDRQTSVTENISTTNNVETKTNANSTDNMGQRQTTTNNNIDDKSRSILYEQGVLAYDNLNNTNIGNLGNDYASNFTDNVNVQNNIQTTSENPYTNTNTANGTSSTNGNGNNTRNYGENIHERRINYYDNLAFLRDRADRLKILAPFQQYFEHLFNHVTSYKNKWW